MPRYTIITPTILRQSLLKCCESVDNQTSTDWQHIVMVDTEITNSLLAQIAHPQRIVLRCDRPHNNWGHGCRNLAWTRATGDYIYCLDDDNYLAHDDVLKYLECVTKPWAIFPIQRLGARFFNDPPARKKTDTGSILVRRDLGPWPALDDYDADGFFVERLLAAHPDYQVVGQDVTYPLMVMPETYGSRSTEVDGSRVSIFTPVHDITYLYDAWNSIKDQDFYEWVVVYNNGGVPIDFHDPRVKSHVLYRAPEKVGALKAYACEQATGGILLELDCDDMLTPTAISEVQQAFSDPEVGFVYSNSIHTTADLGKFPRYSETFGWSYRPATFQGRELDEFVSFPPTPESISRVWYGPDHLRAFRRSVYVKAGGHDKSMRVLDDSDLVCRMYLEARFHHIDKPLYLYRVHGQNSWLTYNQEIQDGVYRVYDTYIDRIVKLWAEREGLAAVELESMADIAGLKDSSVGVIRAVDSLTSIPCPLEAMREIYRVLAPGGWLLCQVPSTDGRGAWQDPRHVSFWNENSFLYYTHRDWAKFINTPVRFQATRLYTTEKNRWQICWTVAHLVSLKDGYRPPGLVEI